MKKVLHHILIPLIFLIIPIQGFSDIPALRAKLDTIKADTSQILVLARLGFEYAFVDIDTARHYSNTAIQRARLSNYDKGLAQGLNNLAISYDIVGEYQMALTYFLEALAIYEQTGDKAGMARVYSNCGIVYQNLEEHEKSIEFHRKSMELEQERNDSVGIAYSMLHIAGLSLETLKYDQAEDYYNDARKWLLTIGDKDAMSYVHHGLGELYLETDRFSEAIEELNKGLKIYQRISDKRGIALTNVLLADVYRKQGELNLAGEKYELAISFALELKASHILVECYEGLSEVYNSRGKYDIALEYYKKFKAEEDEILTAEKHANIEELQRKYDIDKKDQEIEFLNQEKSYQSTIRNIIVVILVLSLLFSGFIYWQFIQKKKAFAALEEQNKLIERKNFIIQVEKQNALQASEAKAQFLSNMSHEIRTPLNSIIGLAYLLDNEGMEPSHKENLRALVFSAQNLLTLVSDILDFSKIEAGKIEFSDVPFNLTDLITNIRHSFTGQVEEKNLKLRLKMDEDIPTTIVGDPSKLSQILTNLVNNAIKFTAEGVVTIDINVLDQSTGQIILEFRVEDTGIGIPVSKQKSIFKSFSQADKKISQEYGGTGLGLAIVKKLLQQKGSEIYVESKPGKGSSFYFHMNFKIGSKAHYISPKTHKATFKSLKGVKILLAEDNKVNELLAVKLLNKWNVEVDVARNGLQVVEMVQMNKYDLILMDIQMPEMDGYEATKIIRKLKGEVFLHIPILALTAAATIETRNSIFECGMNDFIYKPYNPNDLYNKIEQYVVFGSKSFASKKVLD